LILSVWIRYKKLRKFIKEVYCGNNKNDLLEKEYVELISAEKYERTENCQG
jgi:hypothetical protein